MPTKEEILSPSQALVMQLQADIRSAERLITAIKEAIEKLKERGDPHVVGVEAQLRAAQQQQQERQALLRQIVQERTVTIEVIEKAEG